MISRRRSKGPADPHTLLPDWMRPMHNGTGTLQETKDRLARLCPLYFGTRPKGKLLGFR